MSNNVSGTDQGSGRRRIDVDELRLATEVFVLIGQLGSTITLALSDTVPDGVTWTVFSLCVSTITTILQFKKEARGVGMQFPLFTLPNTMIFVVFFLLLLSLSVEQMQPFVESKIVSVTICAVIVLRQIIHIALLISSYKENDR